MSFSKLTMIVTTVLLVVVFGEEGNYSCYKHDVVIKSEPFLRFIVTPGNECREYCKYEAECKTFSFNLDRLTECFLYRENESNLIYETNNASHFMIGIKYCNQTGNVEWSDINMEGQYNPTKSFKMGQKDTVILKRTDMKMCAEVDYTETNSSSSLGYPLFFSSVCERAPQWEIVPSNLDKVFGCAVVTVKAKFGDMFGDMCLSAVNLDGRVSQTNSPTASLRSCKNTKHYLLLCPEGKGAWSLYQHLPVFSPIVIPIHTSDNWSNRRSLSPLDLVTGNKLKTLQNIPCKNVSVRDGRILLEQTVPFFLPGETITVSCNKGFGMQITQGVFRQEFTTNCSAYRRPVVCSKIPEVVDFPRAQNCSSSVQIDSSSSKSSMTVKLLVFLTFLSNILTSP